MNKSLLSRTAILATIVMIGWAVAPFRASADDAAVNSTDKAFLKDAYQDGLAEVATAQLASQKTGNPDVKAFAEKLASDHTTANNALKTLADSKKVSTATEPSMIAQGKSKLLDRKSGTDFDKAYIDAMVSDHKKDIEAFEKEASEAKDQDVKNFASQTLPTLKAHLSAAESIQAKIGK
jgi:putative membrane protein